MRRRSCFQALMIVTILLAGTAQADEVVLEDCMLGGFKAGCGRISVLENRDLTEGRRLDLFVSVVAARQQERLPDPLVILEGGPGASVTHFGSLHAQTFYGVGAQRDLVLLDQRGTGKSSPLDCDLTNGFRELSSPARATACRETLEGHADLAFYTTDDAVQDLVEVLDRLGYERVNLFGVSNGTRTALHFLRRFPERVRTVTLLAPYPFTHNALIESGETLDRSVGLLAADCAANTTCAGAFPRLNAALPRLARKTTQGDGDWALFTAALRMMLFFPLQASQVPNLLTLVDSSGVTPQSQGPGSSPLTGWISEGAYMGTICSEDAARTTVEEVRSRTAGTLLGPGWAQSVVTSCSDWPKRPLPEDFVAPIHSNVPALFLVGRLDPAMPPAWAHEQAETMPGARVVEVAEGQHSFIGMGSVGCILGLMQGFVDSADPNPHPATCTAAITRPPFAPPTRLKADAS
jgi:pimeloyl-ACP methyl ester carboxylesterase